MEILAYITDNRDRILGGGSLILYMPNPEERQEYLQIMAEMLDCEVLEMNNGDHMLLRRT